MKSADRIEGAIFTGWYIGRILISRLSDGDIDPDKNGSGFFWVSYYDRSLGNFASWHVTPVEESYDFNRQYDLPGLGRSGPDPQLK